ncbi:MAG: GntR family transcriptional regulator [Pseudomonadota bacterium]
MVESALPSSSFEEPTDPVTAPREPPLVLQTMRRLLRDIFAGVYGPGDRIREVEVSERYGVSRAPVREALRVLEQDGLIALTPWQGARVIDPKPAEMADLLDLLGAVSGVVARLVARHGTAADLKRLAGDVKILEQYGRERRDPMELVEIAYQFGTHMGRACGSEQAAATFRRVGRPAFWLHRFLVPVPSRWHQQSVNRHRKLLEALRARSEDRSEKAARRLVQLTRNLVLSHALAAQRVPPKKPSKSSKGRST